MRYFLNYLVSFLFASCWTFVAFYLPGAQAQIQEKESLYKSAIDELLTIRTISVLPFSDNLQGIYARPLEAHVLDILRKSHRFDLLETNTVGPILSPEELETTRAQAEQIAGTIPGDAFIAAKIVKGPKGINLKIDLFLKKDAKLLLQEEIENYQIFDVENLKLQIAELLKNMLNKIPYEGRVLSRDGNRVTVNLGKMDGLQVDQTVSVIQIISATRHPKFNFLVSTEKEILGKIKIAKIDDTLSFGLIITEKEKGAIQKEAKISGLDFVTYSGANPYLEGGEATDVSTRPDANVSFGKNPQAWVPKDPPSFGRVGAQLGLNMYSGSAQLASESLEAKSSLSPSNLSPSVMLDGEIWITTNWSVSALIHQALISVDNPRAGSSPSKLDMSFSRYELLGAYIFRVGPDIWGTNVAIQGGWSNAQMFAPDSSPRAFTSTTHSGLKLGLMGSMPVTDDRQWRAGAKFYMSLMNRLRESPVTSGAKNDPKINEFGIFGGKKIAEDLMLTGHLDFLQYSVSFSGLGSRGERATSLTHRFTIFTAGISYFF